MDAYTDPSLAVTDRFTTWTTSIKEGLYLSKREIERPRGTRSLENVIRIDRNHTFQKIQGFGWSLTGGSALLLSQMGRDERGALLHELFSPKDGISASCLRLTIGGSDLSTNTFSYLQRPEDASRVDFKKFNLFAGDQEVVPILKEILKINPDIYVMGSPWSAPPWMKTNDSFIAGELKPECEDLYARYLVKYIETMREQGIDVKALTVQNEPGHPGNEPSMLMSARQQAEFIGRSLGPRLRLAGLATEIFCHDHNCDKPEYPIAVMHDKSANPYTAGAAFHLYDGEAKNVSLVQKLFPDKKYFFTEQWVGVNAEHSYDLTWHGKYMAVGMLRNWAEVVLEWNLAADPLCGPHTPTGATECLGALTIDNNKVTREVAYYTIAHMAKFIPPGSVRIMSDASDAVPNVAFLTPEKKLVVFAVNHTLEPSTASFIDVSQGSAVKEVQMPPRSLVTAVWNANHNFLPSAPQ